MKRFAVVLLLLFGASIAQAKEPWQWTTAERAEARLDDVLRRQRIADYRRQVRSGPLVGDVIDGARHPELFFVTELFEILVQNAFLRMPEAYPHIARQRSSDLFRKQADWERFVAIADDYAAVLRKSGSEAQKCAAASRALREARRVFGRERFDRMLYEVVPSMTGTWSVRTDFDALVRKLRERDERCQ